MQLTKETCTRKPEPAHVAGFDFYWRQRTGGQQLAYSREFNEIEKPKEAEDRQACTRYFLQCNALLAKHFVVDEHDQLIFEGMTPEEILNKVDETLLGHLAEAYGQFIHATEADVEAAEKN